MKTKLNEDWLAVWLGLFLFALSLATFFGGDALGWAVTTSVWTSPWKALAPASKAYSLSGPLSLLLTYAFLLALTTIGAKALRLDLGRFVKGFTPSSSESGPSSWPGSGRRRSIPSGARK